MKGVKNISTIGENIRQKREERGLTQKELADKVGITFAAISQIEAGKTGKKFDTLRDICISLNVSADEILNLEKENSREHLKAAK